MQYLTLTLISTIIIQLMEVRMELGILIASAALSSVALLFSMVAVIMVIAREKATHTVQLVPVDEEVDRANAEYEKALSKYNKESNEEKEEQFPEFALEEDEEDDLDKYSI